MNLVVFRRVLKALVSPFPCLQVRDQATPLARPFVLVVVTSPSLSIPKAVGACLLQPLKPRDADGSRASVHDPIMPGSPSTLELMTSWKEGL
ncbi:MAG: hypothetical protein ACREX4_19070 [Gammaproteobacteria bacterium]